MKTYHLIIINCLLATPISLPGEAIFQKRFSSNQMFEVHREVLPPDLPTKEQENEIQNRFGGSDHLNKPESTIVYRVLLTTGSSTQELWSKRVRHYSDSPMSELVFLDGLMANSNTFLCYKTWDRTYVETLSLPQAIASKSMSRELVQDNVIRPRPVFVKSGKISVETNGVISIELDLSQGRKGQWFLTGNTWIERVVESDISPGITITCPIAVDVSVIRTVLPSSSETNGYIRGRIWPKSSSVVANGFAARVDTNGIWVVENLPIQRGKKPSIKISASLANK